jgi:RNA polymerase sigma-70 factor (ECF subfamily)
MLEDYQIVLRLHRGDAEALRQIYLRYKDSMYATALAVLNDYSAAGGVLHDAFVMFAKVAPGFGLYRSVKNYLAGCVIERSQEALQSKMYRIEEVPRTTSRLSENEDSADEASQQRHIAAATEAMAKVPLPQREAVVLHLYAGLSFREISRVQQVSPTTAQARYSYGLERLAAILDRQVET